MRIVADSPRSRVTVAHVYPPSAGVGYEGRRGGSVSRRQEASRPLSLSIVVFGFPVHFSALPDFVFFLFFFFFISSGIGFHCAFRSAWQRRRFRGERAGSEMCTHIDTEEEGARKRRGGAESGSIGKQGRRPGWKHSERINKYTPSPVTPFFPFQH
ncbi:hypothetical protein GGS23DRAFT_465230 [Durotheca rogersii]|uniref:uncharacterized protein n=1 Tax=Durotheca rogersii TaxID=419775 RepID=UPI0022204A60|nr:uncharacterized protein GGS23DRAFT_465230 [Durotheca rogersii]KAI5864824.1 hypothetical protein GGS23DRAFT_465230 [Durotheca rogersii]